MSGFQFEMYTLYKNEVISCKQCCAIIPLKVTAIFLSEFCNLLFVLGLMLAVKVQGINGHRVNRILFNTHTTCAVCNLFIVYVHIAPNFL